MSVPNVVSGRLRSVLAPRGAALLSIGTLASGLLAYAFNLFAARVLGPTDYGPVAVLWAAMFLVSVVLFRPIELTLSRGIAERTAREQDARPVVRSAARLTVLFAVLAGLAVALAWGPLTNGLFAGRAELTAALAAGIAGYAASYFVRGLASGLRLFGSYGLLLVVDGAARVLLALPLLFLVSPAVAAAAIAGAAVSGALAPIVGRLWRARRTGAQAALPLRPPGAPAGPAFAIGRTLGFAGPVAVIAAAEQILVSGGALLVAVTGGAAGAAAAGTVFAATMLVRAPVFLFQGVAAALLPNLTRFNALGESGAFRRHVVRVGAVMIGGSAVLVVGALAFGPEAMRLLFGPAFEVGRVNLAILSAGVGTYLVAATLAQAGLARGLAWPCAGAWAGGAAVFVAVVLLLPAAAFERVSVAFTLATALVAASLAGLLVRSPVHVEALPNITQEGLGPVLLVCSSGGHLLQLLELRPAWTPFPHFWVAFDKPDTRSLLRDERVIHAHGPTNRNVPNMLRNIRLAFSVIRGERPSAILTTGAGVAVPFAWVGRMFGVPTVYVESFTRIEELSLSARLIAPVASRLYVQWPELAAEAPRMHFAGNLFVNG